MFFCAKEKHQFQKITQILKQAQYPVSCRRPSCSTSSAKKNPTDFPQD